MAKGIDFPQANSTLGAPTVEDAAAGTVYGLRVRKYVDLDGVPNVLSCWELTDEEVELVVLHRRVWFNVWGQTHAPLFITGHDPFGTAGWLKARGSL